MSDDTARESTERTYETMPDERFNRVFDVVLCRYASTFEALAQYDREGTATNIEDALSLSTRSRA